MCAGNELSAEREKAGGRNDHLCGDLTFGVKKAGSHLSPPGAAGKFTGSGKIHRIRENSQNQGKFTGSGKIHRTREWLGWEGSSGDHPDQDRCHRDTSRWDWGVPRQGDPTGSLCQGSAPSRECSSSVDERNESEVVCAELS